MEEYIINNMINLQNKIAQPLYYNGYISMDERAEIRKYIEQLEQALNEIKKILTECKMLMPHEFDWEEQADYILQIIDKVGGIHDN